MHGVSQDASQGAGEAGELVHTASKETLGSPDASELGSPQCTKHFDLYNMVVSYKRMALFLEPVTDAVELIRFLLGCVCLSEPHVVLQLYFMSPLPKRHISNCAFSHHSVYPSVGRCPCAHC